MSVLVQYVGKKPQRADTVAGTGTVWQGPGDIRPIPLAAWQLLRAHPDVWRLVEDDEEDLAPRLQTLASAPVSTPVPQALAATLIGTDKLPEQIEVAGKLYPQLAVLQACREANDLTVEAWNALDNAGREALLLPYVAQLQGIAELQAKQAAGQQPPAPPAPPSEKPAGTVDLGSQSPLPSDAELEAMEPEQLRELALKRGLKPHFNAGKPKLLELLKGGAQ